jgi:Holliday junction resolvase RusA-like endonuclease
VSEPYRLSAPLLAMRIVGAPAPQGSKSAFRNPHTGRIQQVESSKAVKPWRADVKAAAEQAIALRPAAFPLAGPLAAHITFTLPKPTSAPKRTRTWPAKRPDLDKLVRSTLDALKTAGAYLDDAQVVELVTRKAYPLEHAEALGVPGAVVHLYAITDTRPSTPDGPTPLLLEGTY